MYPSFKDPLFGVFVKNFKEGLEEMGVIFTQKSLIKGKSNSILIKSLKYSRHYINIILSTLKSNYDLVYIHYLTHHLPVLFVLLPFKSKKWVVNVHGSDILSIKASSIMDKIAIVVLNKIDLIVVPTSYFRDLIIKKYPFLITSKFYISPSGGINPNKFYVKDKKEPNEILNLGFISRFIEEKGWRTFLEALIILKNNHIPFKSVIAGQGPDSNKIMEFIKKTNLTEHIEFLGLVKQDKLVDIYNSLDLYIFPTYREAESLGLTGLEAMSCGTPVISCNMAGPSTYIKNGINGYLFTPKNSTELGNIIIAYNQLDNKTKMEFINNSIKTSVPYSTAHVNQKLYQKLANM